MAFSKARRLANLMSSASDTVPAAKVVIADDAIGVDQLANSINTNINTNNDKLTNATHTGDVTGSGALTIAVDAVDIPMLSASGTANNTTFLRGDNAWASVPAGVDIQSSVPSVAAEGSLYYNSTTDKLYLSNGTAWVQVSTNSAPLASGGTITIPAQAGLSSFSYNLGLGFTDADNSDDQLTYTLESGTLPAGAVLPTTGNTTLTGTATNQATATYNFVIRATDGANAHATQAFTQTINISFVASGGTVTTISGYKVHTFTSSGNFVANSPKAVEYLVIAGGGAGGKGYQGAGGGAGGYRSNVPGQVSGGGASAESTLTIASGSHAVTVGAGATQGTNTVVNGVNSVFSSITSIGGGGGGNWNVHIAGNSGGSGGGSANGHTAAVAGTAGQGYAGGKTSGYGGTGMGGGGGGASAIGKDGMLVADDGRGGDGASSNINGTATVRAGGGGAGGWSAAGAGGAGGGGSGSDGASGTSLGVAGTANTGGGGGGTGALGYNGAAGGSGIVIIRYAV